MKLDALIPGMKLAAGRLVAFEAMPYFRAALMSLIPREAPGLGTFGVTERHVLMWDPAAAERWTVPEIGAVLLHEVGHVLRDHAKRARALGIDPRACHTEEERAEAMLSNKLWNISCDAEINDDLRDAKIQLPSFTDEDGKVHSCVYPDQAPINMPAGNLAEAYYARLQQQVQPPKSGGKGKGGKGQGTQGSAPGKGSGKDPGQDGKGQGAGGKPGHGWCGSGAGRAMPGEPSEAEEPGRSEVDVGRIRAETARAIQAHAERGQGNVPEGWKRWASEQLKPSKVPWRKEFARAARGAMADLAGAMDYRYSRPPRRALGLGMGEGKPIFPIMRSPIPRVAFAVDTSGSMSDAALRDAMSEADAVLRALGSTVVFLTCDAIVRATGPVRRWQDALPLLKGGGGTDFRPVFDAVANMPARPDILIFATDGCGPAPEVQPKGLHVIWLLIGAGSQAPCTWGKQITVRAEERA